ncbi:hypothetical protein K2173_018583 [Erythroxylum novogranatense]|uniref:NAC domain-containing protein n=1 Tax=Erythroxylum novogranatense TaxID=1862640 RepID=A0AAV8UB00_9ROSI|nr:hypothetical protein K2173_018583 [Erythroxylum novogranatense]
MENSQPESYGEALDCNYAQPGFRFYPTEEELISFYLHNKLQGKRKDLNRAMNRVIPVLDICGFNPWDLPQMSGELCRGNSKEWFFFVRRQESEARGGRPKRQTATGYWKATGTPSSVYSSSNNRCIGEKRTMVFYNGRAPVGRKTEWKMNEYKILEEVPSSTSLDPQTTPSLRNEFSVCRVYKDSKVLRSYDRRPSFAVGKGEVTGRVERGHDQTRTSHGNSTVALNKISSSEKEYSCDHVDGHSSQSSNIVAPLDIEASPLWEWENNFYDIMMGQDMG